MYNKYTIHKRKYIDRHFTHSSRLSCHKANAEIESWACEFKYDRTF